MSNSSVKESGLAIGIDLGTQNSCVGMFRNGEVSIIPDSDGNVSTPNYVAFTESEILIGNAAKNQVIKNLPNTVFDAKRLMGRNFEDPELQQAIKHWPFKVINEKGRPKFEVDHKSETMSFFPEEISAMVISELRKKAEASVGQTIKDVVITVPSQFNESQRQALLKAAAISGMNVLDIISDTMACGITYGLERKVDADILILSIGKSNCSASVIKIEEKRCTVRCTSGDTNFGGEDFSNKMVEHFIQEFKDKYEMDISQDKIALMKLRTECEIAKTTLSSECSATINIEDLYEGIPLCTSITRVTFNDMCLDLFDKIILLVFSLLNEAKIDKSKIHDVMLIGGTTEIPRLQEKLRIFFADKIPINFNETVDNDNNKRHLCEAITKGAAVWATILKDKSCPRLIEAGSDLLPKFVEPLSIGIDLGTKNSSVGIFLNGKVTIINNSKGKVRIPNYVAFTESMRVIGDAAKTHVTENPENTVFDAKKLFGRNFDDPKVQDDMKHWPFKVISDGGRPKIQVDCKSFSPEEISAMVLLNLKNTVEAYIGKTITDAVITVPSQFNVRQRQATRDAAAISGIKVLRILSDTAASGLTYGFEKKLGDDGVNILIFSLSGCNCSVSVMNIEKNSHTIRCTSGDTHFGGEDFDNMMVKHCIKLFRIMFSNDISEDKIALRNLRTSCENSKITLSSSDNSIITTSSGGITLRTSMTRKIFEIVCRVLFDKVLSLVKNLLSDANISKFEIDDVMLVGGSTKIPKVQNILCEFFGRNIPISIFEPEEAVAHGAAIQAAILHRDKSEAVKDLLLEDVAPFSLRVEKKTLIERNASIPTTQTHILTNMSSCHMIKVYNDEGAMTKDNNLLGKYQLIGIPPVGGQEVKLTFEIDADSIVHVSAVDERTNNEITITNDLFMLSKVEIEEMANDANNFKFGDKLIVKSGGKRAGRPADDGSPDSEPLAKKSLINS